MADGDMTIGKPISRIDGSKKVAGRALYAAEYDAPGLLHAAVVSSRIAKGKITAIDAIEALALPGVIAVLTHENRPRVAAFRYAYKDTVGPPGGPFKPLHDGKIRFADQPVAVVVGETLEAARDGAALVRITYEEEAFETDLDAAKAASFRPRLPRLGVKPAPKPRGDFDAAFAAAPIKIAAAYETAAQHHNAMELFATTVVWEGEDKITVYDKTQGSQNVQLYLKQALGFKLKNVRVVNAFVGGAFGSGLRPAHSAFLATLAAKHLKRSVRLVLTRAQMFSITYRADTRQEIALACDAEGRLLAVRHACVAATSRNEDQQETIVNWAGLAYACDNAAFDYQLARVDTPTPGDMRAPGAAVGVHVLECAMDELAYAAGIDPLDLRLRNWVEHDQNDDLPLTSKAQKACYAQAAERFGWSERSFGPRTMRDGHELIGWGVAGGVWDAFVAPVPTRARVTWRRDGRLEVAAAASDIGTGTYTILAQIAAEAFGVSVERVEVRLGDSTLPFNPVEGGSWMAASTGAAVAKACDKLKAALVKTARKQFKLRGKSALSVARGAVIGEALPGGAVSLNEILAAVGQDIAATGTNLPDLAGQRKHSSYVHSAVFAEVRVDEELGVIRVKRIVSAIAAGRILNPKTAGSQIIGGMVMGIGQALHEEAQTDHRFGKVMNHSFQDYHVPANADVGDIEVIFVQEHDPDVSSLGVKGVGEIGLVGVAPAIANAVFHATGKRIRSTPITIDKLLD
ncbi:xanthine dehydrogenase family protein molybdopterin-binding subunit [Caulobacter endophyticus]|uniref:xanthine dehydrogenase family protein molybdopterin-binding subunit n=1 Tax=Caulobacter endophyticus TaxID=2172652 RepID=UPI0024106674|nr:xanthine dehydrogenase family protein molybdopterin-binding subunit [Caulobacter endophyticus]MDG2528108.1 xanthine dehydrogenase family protein molybdopterin-binding subunit [Caulobacter endophyticus]